MGQNLGIHPETIEEIKQRVDIIDIVSDFIVLRKRGKDYVGSCPFHEEKTPSFTVSPHKQMYYCFGCQAGGNAIKFLMELGKRSFSEVILDLAGRYQIPVKTLLPEQQEELQHKQSLKEHLYQILAVTADFYQYNLRQHGKEAQEYLQKTRQLSQETIDQFQLGLTPAGWGTLYGYLVDQKHYPVELVEKAGLIKKRQSGNGYYDVFRDRLIIPIWDIQGKIIGFGGRSLGDEQPKYLNSPETELFDKGKNLFALDRAKTAISKQDKAIVVEGYFDAIALHAAGINNVVASLGTALSLNQIRLLLRYTESKQIILNFDTDQAGTKATERAIGEIADLAYRGEVKLRVINLPEGKDADEYLKNYSAVAYREIVDNAPLWIDWQIEQILKDKNLKQGDQYQLVAEEMVKLMGKINNNDTRSHYINHCAEILSQGESRLIPLRANDIIKQINKPRKKIIGNNKNSALKIVSDSGDRTLLERAETRILRIYLHCSEYRQAIIDILEERRLQFTISHHRFLWRSILEIPENFELNSTDLIAKLQDKYIQFPEHLSTILNLFHLNENTEKDIIHAGELIQAAAACIERVMCEKRSRHFLELWQKTNPVQDPKMWQYYTQEFYAIKARIKELDTELNFLYFYR